MVDKPKLDQMVLNLRAYIDVLKRLGRTPQAQFLADSDMIGNAKYHFVVAIECCIDVANHIIASQGFRFPRSNADSFAVLIENGVVEEDLRGPLTAMARFRNRLVHLYWAVDDPRVHDYLQDSLPYLERFAQAIASREW